MVKTRKIKKGQGSNDEKMNFVAASSDTHRQNLDWVQGRHPLGSFLIESFGLLRFLLTRNSGFWSPHEQSQIESILFNSAENAFQNLDLGG